MTAKDKAGGARLRLDPANQLASDARIQWVKPPSGSGRHRRSALLPCCHASGTSYSPLYITRSQHGFQGSIKNTLLKYAFSA